MKQLDFSKTENTGSIERALTGIAFSSHPSHGVVSDLKVSGGKLKLLCCPVEESTSVNCLVPTNSGTIFK